MHFCVSAARVSDVRFSVPSRFFSPHQLIAFGQLETSGERWPRKMGTNWFMPALVKSRFGESGSRLDEGTMVWSLDRKKSRKDWRIWALVMKKCRVSSVECGKWRGETGECQVSDG